MQFNEVKVKNKNFLSKKVKKYSGILQKISEKVENK